MWLSCGAWRTRPADRLGHGRALCATRPLCGFSKGWRKCCGMWTRQRCRWVDDHFDWDCNTSYNIRKIHLEVNPFKSPRQSLYNPHIIPYHLYKNSVNVHIKIRFCRSPILAWSCCTTCVSRTTWARRCAARSCWGLRARCCWAAWRRRWAGVQWLLQGALLVGGLEHQFYFPIYWE